MDAQILIDKIDNFDIPANTKPPKPDKYSVKKFMNIDLSGSHSIRAGYFFEHFLKNVVSTSGYCHLFDDRFLNGNQIDLFFINNKTGILYYFEVKTNVNNDSEKVLAVIDKINSVIKAKEISAKEFKYGILCPTNINEKNTFYKNSNIQIYSLSEFLDFVGIIYTKEQLQNIVFKLRNKYYNHTDWDLIEEEPNIIRNIYNINPMSLEEFIIQDNNRIKKETENNKNKKKYKPREPKHKGIGSLYLGRK
jgi:hypothetical protein